MLAVVGDFEHACGEGSRPFTFAGERLQPVQEFLDPFEFQCRAEIYGEQFAYGDHRSQSAHGQRAMFQIVVHRLLVQGGNVFGERVQRYRAASVDCSIAGSGYIASLRRLRNCARMASRSNPAASHLLTKMNVGTPYSGQQTP